MGQPVQLKSARESEKIRRTMVELIPEKTSARASVIKKSE
jgi:hypothetical protein